jgi:MoaE-MoaD fusion protein
VSHRIRDDAFSPEETVREVEGADCGAVVTFVGVVRDHNHGKRVVALEYEVFHAMALKVFATIEEQARTRFPGARLAIHHRQGRLTPGQISVVIAAATPHRADAFEACRNAIEALKQDAPIWKRETYPDGSVWVGLGS